MTIEGYRHPILFYGASLALPTGFWALAGKLSHLPDQSPGLALLTTGIGLAGLCCPVAIAAILIFRDPLLRRDLFGRIFNFERVNPLYLLLAPCLMLLSLLAGIGISLLFGRGPEQFEIGRGFSFSAGALPAWFILLLAPLIEELAWHSYGTDCLRRSFNLFIASMVFAAFWVVWHMPLSLIKDYYQAKLAESGALASLNFAVSIFPFVILMNWLYMKAGRNLPVAIVFHVSASFYGELFPAHPDAKLVQTGILLLLSVLVLVKERKLFFSRELAAAGAPC